MGDPEQPQQTARSRLLIIDDDPLIRLLARERFGTEGFDVVEMLGMGVNPVTGDYSRGAAGFLIENGAITHPVSEVTVAGNLLRMFAALTPANDLEFRDITNAPTLRVEGMTVAGA